MRYELDDEFSCLVRCSTKNWSPQKKERAVSLAREMGYQAAVSEDTLEIYTERGVDLGKYWKTLDTETP